MRLTSPLFFRGRVVRIFKEKWKAAGNKKITEDEVPETIKQMAVDVLSVVKPVVNLPIVPVPEPWVHTSTYKELNSDVKRHPHCKDGVCHEYMPRYRLLEGLKQAQLLTNTVVKNGLPKHIEDLLGFGEKDDQDDLVKRVILGSQIWDGTQIKLPKRIDMSRPHYRLHRDYGIPKLRQIELLVRNILRLTELQGSFHGLMARNNFSDVKNTVHTMKGEDLFKFDAHADLMVTSKNPLPLLVGLDEIATLHDSPLPDIYPMKYTVDFKKIHIYEKADFYSIQKSPGYHIHTIYMYDPQPERKWSSSQRLARALMGSYIFAFGQARSKYGVENTKLPHPIVIQCVQSDGRIFSFLSFQLNTLHHYAESSERNVVWIQPDVPLYDVCVEKDGKVYFEGYNSDVYENFLAMSLNGMTPV